MVVRFLAVIALALFVGFSTVQAQQQLTIYASIVDGTGAPATTVQPADLRVMENNADAMVLKVEPVNWPTKLQLLLDNGVGLGSGNLIHLKNGVKALLDGLPPGIEVTLVTTAPQPRFLVRGTLEREAMTKGLDLLGSDSGAGRFIESLNEATQRIERDKTDFFPAIISFATTSGDNNVLERDIERIMKRLEVRPTTVHVVLFSGGARSQGGGANQTQVGISVTQYTKGKFENINAPTRISSLLPELGAMVGKSHERQSKQFRITAQRPAGASGQIGKVSMGARSGMSVAALSFDGRMP